MDTSSSGSSSSSSSPSSSTYGTPESSQDFFTPPPTKEEENTQESDASSTSISVFDYNNFEERSKNDNYRVFLAGADSIHDFDDRGGRVLESSWDSLNTLLRNNLDTISIGEVQDNEKYYTNWLSRNSGGVVTSASQVEAQTIEYFEGQSELSIPLNVASAKILTYRQILDAIQQTDGNTINEKVYQAGLNIFGNYETNILDVDMEPIEDWDIDYSPQDKIVIGLFFLNFFFPPPPQNEDPAAFNTRIPSYMTFDAGSNIPSKIFGLLDQVINLVTPLNIADSALGETHLVADKSQKRAGVKNRYEFPINVANRFEYRSNIYTRSEQILYITSPTAEPYSEKNRYQFNINIAPTNLIGQLATAIAPMQIVFDPQHNSGPSVKYLSNLVAWNGEPGTAPYLEGKMADLTTLVQTLGTDKKLLLDLKRSGDWEQCNAAYVINTNPGSLKNRVILCTIDRLCSLYSRCIGQNTIWHHSTHLKFYRFPGGDVDIAQIMAEQEAKQKAAAKVAAETIASIKPSIGAVLRSLVPILPIEDVRVISKVILRGMKSKEKNPNIFKNDLFFSNVARLYLLQTFYEMHVLLNTTDPHAFFKKISTLFGQSVTPLNYEPFIAYLNKPIVTLDKDNITYILEKCKFGYYDYITLISMKDVFYSILTFDATKISRSIDIKNYKEDLEKNGFFAFLENMRDFSREKLGIDIILLQRMIELRYEGNTIRESNTTYYNALQHIINEILNIDLIKLVQDAQAAAKEAAERQAAAEEEEQQQRLEAERLEQQQRLEEEQRQAAEIQAAEERQRQAAEEQQTQDRLARKRLNEEDSQPTKKLKEEVEPQKRSRDEGDDDQPPVKRGGDPIQNIITNTENTLTEEFVILCASLTEIAESRLPNNYSSNFIEFVQLFKGQNVDFASNRIEIEDKISDFLKNSSMAIQKMIDTIRPPIDNPKNNSLTGLPDSVKIIINNYMSIYFVLACFYLRDDLINIEDTSKKRIITYLLSDTYNWNQNSKNRTICYELMDEICRFFYPEYSYTLTKGDNVSIGDNFFIFQFALKLILTNNNGITRNDNNIENIVFIVFVFFQNFFKYVIGTKTGFSNNENGYNQGILTEFTNDASSQQLFQSLKIISESQQILHPIDNSGYWEFQQNTHILSGFSSILFCLLQYISSENYQLIRALRQLSGGSGSRKKRKTVKNRGRRAKTYKEYVSISKKRTIQKKHKARKTRKAL
jgi:hypothetical protein